MFGILFNKEPMGIQSQTEEFKYLTKFEYYQDGEQ